MKKLSLLNLLLCLVLLVQMLCAPVLATETETSMPTETMETEGLEVEKVPVPDVAYGTASVAYGCRTVDGQAALGGDSKLLETAKAVFVFEKTTGSIIYNYNEDTTLSPGALTKIMTAIVAIEREDLTDKVTISTAGYTGIAGTRNSALKQGEVLTLEDLLHCLILQMANDAAVSIAEYVSGTEAAFVNLMNETAKSIGCTDTVFLNCHGLDVSGQHTTARDMARILQYALKNSTFREIFGCKTYTVPVTDRSEKRELNTLNHLVGSGATKFNYDGVTGGMGTYASASGASIVCTAEKDGMSLICVILGATRTYTGNAVKYYGNYEEIWDLLDYSFDNFKICRLLHNGQSMSQFSVANGENQVVGMTSTDMDAVLPASVNLEDLTLKYNVEGGGLTAPIEAGQRVSTLQVWCGDSCVAETELYAMSNVRAVEDSQLDIQGVASRDDSNLSGFLSFVGVVFLVILALAAAYLIVKNVRYSIARKRRRRRRQSARSQSSRSQNRTSGNRNPQNRRRRR